MIATWVIFGVINILILGISCRYTEDDLIIRNAEELVVVLALLIACILSGPLGTVYAVSLIVFEKFIKGKVLIKGKQR